MDFAFSSDQLEIQRVVRDFVDRELIPAQAQMDASHEFPYHLWEQWSALGMAGIMIPEAYGGTALDPMTYIMVLEEVARFAALTNQQAVVAEQLQRFAKAGHEFFSEFLLHQFVERHRFELGIFFVDGPAEKTSVECQKLLQTRRQLLVVR